MVDIHCHRNHYHWRLDCLELYSFALNYFDKDFHICQLWSQYNRAHALSTVVSLVTVGLGTSGGCCRSLSSLKESDSICHWKLMVAGAWNELGEKYLPELSPTHDGPISRESSRSVDSVASAASFY